MPRSSVLFLLCAAYTCIVTAQIDQLDIECNILQTVNDLKDRLVSAETTIRQQNIETADLRDSLTGAKATIADLKDSQASADILLNDLRDYRSGAETEIASLKHSLKELRGGTTHSTYIRWGRTSCPGNGSELIYAGYTGGSDHDKGHAVGNLYLPTNPDFTHYEDGVKAGGYVYGAEYRMLWNRDNGMAFFPGSDQSVNLLFQDVPCAVCMTVRSTVLMVPAKTTCHDGWTLEYKGYLSSENADLPVASQYFCLDDQPEYIPDGSTRNDNSKYFHLVEGRCGSLKCPPYVEGRELTCAVCSV